MDLLAISYSNIGPFTDKIRSLFFQPGSYLIKAPIGSGKSFLFFDGPVFALFKYAKRPMLHRQARSGRVHALFTCEHEIRYIERAITPTKAGGESVSSRLWKVSLSKEHLEQRIALYAQPLVDDVDCKELIEGDAEEILFTSQKELDASMQLLLPAREATLAVNFLMQDSENVFELPPLQRVVVFKHLFGLLGIDEAKDRLADKRRELQGMIRVLGDQSQATTLLQQRLQKVSTLQQAIKELPLEDELLLQGLSALRAVPFFVDLPLIQQEVRIDQFSLEAAMQTAMQMAMGRVAELLREKERISGKQHVVDTDIASLQAARQLSQTTMQQKQQELAALERQLAAVSIHEVGGHNQRRDALLNELEQYKKPLHADIFLRAGYTVSSLADAVRVVDMLVEQGKEQMHMQTLLQTQREQLDRSFAAVQQRKKEVTTSLEQIEQAYSQETRFYCDKIEGDCPYIEVIKKQSVMVLQRQRDGIVAQQEALLVEEAGLSYETERERLDQHLLSSKQHAETIRALLQEVNRKEIKEAVQTVQSLQDELASVSTMIAHSETISKQFAQMQQVKQEKAAEITLLQQEVATIDRQRDEKQEEKQRIEGALLAIARQQLLTAERMVQELSQQLHDMQQAVEQHRQSQLRLKQLQDEEGKVKELYAIFSKELLFVVLQDFLPQLEQAINAYLAQVVDYEIRFLLPNDDGEALELDIEIHDHNGIRPVKSLSGGQKAVLKLSRILAVASLMRSSFLFLDETINSLDSDTIGKVAEMFQGFIASKGVKVYLVTHAPQIQEMDIRTQVIEVTPLAKPESTQS